jgi:hypothetical protein
MEHVTFYHGLLTLCGECYDACMCIPDRVITMDSDETVPALMYMLLGACGLL